MRLLATITGVPICFLRSISMYRNVAAASIIGVKARSGFHLPEFRSAGHHAISREAADYAARGLVAGQPGIKQIATYAPSPSNVPTLITLKVRNASVASSSARFAGCRLSPNCGASADIHGGPPRAMTRHSMPQLPHSAARRCLALRTQGKLQFQPVQM
jgi:hypothetical protein